MPSTVNSLQRDCPLAVALAVRLRASKRELVTRWLERVADRVSMPANRIFPTDDLLDHVPLLVEGIAEYLEDPSEGISSDIPVVGKAMELGALRHAQGFDAYEILKEYEILGGILFNFLAEEADTMDEPCAKSELLVCGHRLFRAIAIIQQTTTAHYMRLADQRVKEREERLRGFNYAMSHEIKNHVGAILGAADLLQTLPDATPEQRAKFVEIIMRRGRAMKGTIENLVELARLHHDARRQRHVRLPEAAQEAARQVRESAQAARVEIVVDTALPDEEVNAAVVELALTNYLSNAIKYTDPRTRGKVTISAKPLTGPDPRLVVRVTDNGLGVPQEKRDKLFQRFFRAHETVTRAEGTGLGLSIVKEVVESIGGKAWAEFPEQGSVFAFSLPYRRTVPDRRETSPRPSALG